MPYEKVEVECYSGPRANERPVAFIFEDRRWEIVDVIDRWFEGGVQPGRGAPAWSLVAAVGPAIGPCCYEVGDEVVRGLAAVLPLGAAPHVVRRDVPEARARVDLKLAAALLLEAGGVPPRRIHVAPWCTGCRQDLFHSFRRDGASAGRMLATIGPSHP